MIVERSSGDRINLNNELNKISLFLINKDKNFSELLKNKTLELLENKKFHEYYNFKNGDCLGANNFSWSAALYLDLKFN